jgi:capsid protein
MPLLDPDKEGTALSRLIRNGLLTWPEAVRERGYDPDEVLAEITAWNGKFDAAGVVLDCDPRRMSQQGQPTAPGTSAIPSSEPDDEDEEDGTPGRARRNGHRGVRA